MFRTFLPVRVVKPLRLRLRAPDFFCRKWLLLGWPTRTLPFLLSLTRSLVPLWVFNLGTLFSLFCLGYCFAAAPDDKIELFARELRGLVDNYCITKIVNYLVSKLETDLLMGQFSAPVENGQLNLVTGWLPRSCSPSLRPKRICFISSAFAAFLFLFCCLVRW
jgi:hypothetical protein